MQSRQRVVVTGIGLVTPNGLDEQTFWRNMLEGRNAIRQIRAFDTAELKCRNGAEVDTAQLEAALAARDMKSLDRTVDMILVASAQALEQAGLVSDSGPYEPRSVAVIMGSSNGPTHSQAEGYAGFAAKGIRGIRPTTIPRAMVNAVSAHVSIRYRLTGTNYTVVSACTSSTNAIGIAYRMIRDGYARQVLCGGTDSLFSLPTYTAWNNLGAMSRNPDPARASRPFDRDRDGFVMGEGAGAFLLESLESAQGRGVHIRSEICGYGESSDADHISHPSPEGQALAMHAALGDAQVAPQDIGFINAHGTGTKANDESESRAIRLVFGEAAARIPVASNKSYFGHLMGAAGIVEVIATVLGLEAGRVPGNLNLDNPDPVCDVNLVGRVAQPVTQPLAMKNSFGFGGSNGVLILRRWATGKG